MGNVQGNAKLQREATIDEYVKAYMDGHFHLAKKIRRANPDIWPVQEGEENDN